eukprot:TRINITY_DN13208_c0_g1_i2.p1 TRINITY_DN13208_c0_g1~~TRINITY_DN13208_c0_g1_i2.p1  ORF type:complete len:506 (+),score=91.66 TRINITY_DN13208_c0_g1_i2:121-1638(+)
MAEIGSEGSLAISCSTPNWWNNLPRSSLINMNPWNPQNSTSNSTCEDMSISNSFTNASNHSCLSVENAPRELIESTSSVTELSGESASENHLWSQILLSVETNGDMHNSHGGGENYLDSLSSKALTTEMFEPASDFLKKLDNSWEFHNSMPFNGIEKQLNSYDRSLIGHERSTNTSDLVSKWSIAPPDPQQDRRIAPATCNISMNSFMDRYSNSFLSQMRQDPPDSSSFSSNGGLGNGDLGHLSSYGHELKRENQIHGMEASEAQFLRSFSGNGMRFQMGLKNSMIGDSKKCHYGISDVPCSNNPRDFSELISFSGNLNKPLVDFPESEPGLLRSSSSPDSKKQGHETCSLTRGNGREIASGGKKKRSEENSETIFKKPKQESSTTSSPKIQVPKVKLADRITALQQIVSPFGKTDTASVLQEAIGYIKFLQEQVQLLSNPYMKSGTNKDHMLWGALERKDKSETKPDLKSRGLCLIPISCTPQVYRDNTGPDYWTPTYRGCLYR